MPATQPAGLRGMFAVALDQTNASLRAMENNAKAEQRAAQEKMLAQEREQHIANQNLRIKLALDSLRECITVSDTQGAFVYGTPAAKKFLQKIAAPGFDTDQYYGKKLSDLLNDPEQIERFNACLHSDTGQSLDLAINGCQFRLIASLIHSPQGDLLGRISHWTDRTDEIKSETEVANIVAAAGIGDFSRRISTEGKSDFFADLSIGMNELLQTTEQGLSDVAQVLAALAEGDLTQRMTRDYLGLFGKVKDSVNASSANLTRVIGEVRAAADALTGAANQVSGRQ